MPSNSTENYGLSQWKESDHVLMEDFNADNARIDEALKAAADERAELGARVDQKAEQAEVDTINAALSTKGNCQIWTKTYTGNGKYGTKNPTKVTFPKLPAFVVVLDYVGTAAFFTPGVEYPFYSYGYSASPELSWSGNTVSLTGDNATQQMNQSNTKYFVVAFIQED